MQEMQVQFLGQEDSLEKAMATHSSILSWEIPWAEECGWSHKESFLTDSGRKWKKATAFPAGEPQRVYVKGTQKKQTWFLAFANFCGVNIPTVADFQPPMGCHWGVSRDGHK